MRRLQPEIEDQRNANDATTSRAPRVCRNADRRQQKVQEINK